MAQNPTFVITMADGREMTGELYPEIAPQSVGNFAALANSNFYDGLIFHRVIPGFIRRRRWNDTYSCRRSWQKPRRSPG